MQKLRCQSCGMPLEDEFYGTNADDSENEEYCRFCYQDGKFNEPYISLNQMIARSVENMTEDFSFSQEKAYDLATTVIPTLKRWKKN